MFEILYKILWLVLGYWLVKKIYIWTRYFIIRRQNYTKEAQLAQAKSDKTYDFEIIDHNIIDTILECENVQDLLFGQFTGKFTCKQIVTVACDRAYRIGRKHNLTADE
jgi:hypothetical protein